MATQVHNFTAYITTKIFLSFLPSAQVSSDCVHKITLELKGSLSLLFTSLGSYFVLDQTSAADGLNQLVLFSLTNMSAATLELFRS